MTIQIIDMQILYGTNMKYRIPLMNFKVNYLVNKIMLSTWLYNVELMLIAY